MAAYHTHTRGPIVARMRHFSMKKFFSVTEVCFSVSVKESCFCDINSFSEGNYFQFLCSNVLFLRQKYLFFGDIIHDFQGEVSVKNGSFCYL